MAKGFSIKNPEDEIKALEEAIKAEEEKINPKAPEAPEVPAANDQSGWQKRYSDLRSFAAKKENELAQKVQELQRQLAEATNKAVKFPKTEDEVNEWATKYPDIYDLIVTIAKKNAIEVTQDLDTRVNAQAEREHAYAKQVAYDALVAAHPDFFTVLRDSDDFVAWLETQPLYIYNALYENETDALQAIRAIDLYKADRGITKAVKQPKEDPKQFATAPVQTRGAEKPANEGELKFTESKIAKMSWREQEANMAEIEKAMQNPAFYDLSGGAR